MAAPRTKRSRSVLYVIVLVAITLLTGQRLLEPIRYKVQDAETRLDELGARAAQPLVNQVQKQLSYQDLKKQNQSLRDELAKAKASELRYDDAVRQYKELLALNGFEDPDKTPSVKARIIGTMLNNTDKTIRIDKGSAAGIQKDMPVVSADGLVGRVTETTASYAQVMLITDQDMSVGVRFSRTGEVAIARGQGIGEPVKLDLVSPGANVNKGDKLMTSGLQNSRFPAGLPVGIVKEVSPGAISQEVQVTPAVDLSHISFVKVLKRVLK